MVWAICDVAGERHRGAEVLLRCGGFALVVLTASVASDDIERALVSGADVYITKPVDLGKLEATIETIARYQRADLE